MTDDLNEQSKTAKAMPDPLSQLQRLQANGRHRRIGRFWRFTRRSLGITALLVVAAAVLFWLFQRGEMPETAIFQGVTYTCERMPETDESSGLVHIVCVDLNAPGIELYTTPVDPTLADNPNWQYRLKTASTVLSENELSIVVNGTQFSSDSYSLTWEGKDWPIRLSGDLAKSNEIMVSNGVLNNAETNQYLLWFEEDLTPHLETEKNTVQSVLPQVKWGVGALGILVKDGKLNRDRPETPDTKTLIGINPETKQLWLATFESASIRVAARKLVEQGALDVVRVDGGSSSTMKIGSAASHMRSGTVMGGWIPTATHFGVRARNLAD
ncbi:phosphodiester glycosidase family protein [Blastopirellula marina]|uniref:Phosphodiester glycosidase domain-containing protein n=1 Tax=Blastopirellula marina TaxID=124 RepID=A0A2S8G0U1_9BACT|nr:phosphodiester glycosidase family protein [Blastopirellula marina]PQO38057.1 hypothetical protein C5Y98_08205 [Blastopirellula marina]PTL44713.1 hypothetical protein C5Y97_08205 [Blastopirellula marina]